MTAPMPPRLLEGVRVIDLTWILVGPGATRLLASRGAEVMRIEPTDPRWVDLARYVPPFIQDTPGPPEDPYGRFRWRNVAASACCEDYIKFEM